MDGTSLIFQRNATKSLTEYFSRLTNSKKDSVPSVIKYKDEASSTRNEPSSSTATAPPPPATEAEPKRMDGVLPAKQSRPSPAQNAVTNHSMDEDIDDMLELNALRRQAPTSESGTGIPHIDAALRNMPTVRLHIFCVNC
jgi:hypothetical protein